MPPKLDKEEVKKKKPLPIIIEGVDILEVTFSKLQELTLRLFEKLLNSREERITLQIERDKLRAFWEITRQEIDLCRSTNIIQDNDLQETETERCRLLKEIDQELKYVGYQHKQNITVQNKADMAMFAFAENVMSEEEILLLGEKKNFKEKLREMKFENEDQLRSIREQNLENFTEVKISTKNKLIDMQIKMNSYFNRIIDQLTLKHEMEMSEIEERKNGHITELKDIHKYQCLELKGYYNSVTKENLAVISSLKDSIDRIKHKETEMAKEVEIITTENENMKEPLAQTLAQVKELRRILGNYERDLDCLYSTQRSIEKTTTSINELKSENETKCLEIQEIRNTRYNNNSLSKPFVTSAGKHLKTPQEIHDLEDMIKLLNIELKSKVKTLNKAINESPDKMSEIITFLEKNCLTVEDIQYELCLVCKAHDDLIKSYERKLEEFGIDKNELGFKPLLLENIGLGPAGLVTKNL